MEVRRVGALLLMMTVVGVFVGQTRAAFQVCYARCFVLCVFKPGNSIMCSLKCLKDCIIPFPRLHSDTDTDAHTNTQYFCNLGCASSLCTNISTKQDPGGKKVEGCVNSCYGMCTKDYSSP